MTTITIDEEFMRQRDPMLISFITRNINEPLARYFKCRVKGIERIPKGACLYVGNHSSGMLTPDTFLFCGEAFKQRGLEAMPYSLAHQNYLKFPGFQSILPKLGAIPASPKNADHLLSAGHKILVYPGGDVDNMRAYRDRNKIVFDGRKGFIRLALRNNVPIVPVVSAGAHSTFIILHDMQWFAKTFKLDKIFRLKVFPLTLSMPWGITFGVLPLYLPYPTRILIEALEPITFERCGPEAAEDDDYVAQCAQEVKFKMQRALDRLSKERRQRN